MDNTSDLEVHGHWWLADRPDNKVSGVLRFDPDKGGVLRLIGSFRRLSEAGETVTEPDGTQLTKFSQDSLQGSGVYPRILGEDDWGQYTLDDCLSTHFRSQLFRGGGEETVSVSSILHGAAISDPLDMNQCSVRMHYLPHWIMCDAIKEQHLFRDEKNPAPFGYELSVKRRDPERVVLEDGTEVILRHSIGIEGNRVAAREVLQDFRVEVTPSSRLSIDDILEISSDFQDLVSIATGRIAEFRSVALCRSDVRYPPIGDVDRGPRPLQYYAAWSARDASTSDLSVRDVYFTFSDIGGIDGVRLWLDSAAVYRSTLGRVMSTRYSGGMLVSDRLLNCTAALEAFDKLRTGYGNSTFATRISRAVSFAGTPFEVVTGSDSTAWVNVVRYHRDDIAHHLGRNLRRDAPDLHVLGESLYWLYVMCALRQANAPIAVFEKLARDRRILGLGRNVRDVVVRQAARL
ncbi:hypothetical protein ACGFIF_32525 [Kribbella sp. NPDC049174]|uniref:ApeA N-terminal domain 1-containing protein n=1 Tax=Kribbella sp. NPDC049174 TaxID=3364112 RepID=UPI0037137E57